MTSLIMAFVIAVETALILVASKRCKYYKSVIKTLSPVDYESIINKAPQK